MDILRECVVIMFYIYVQEVKYIKMYYLSRKLKLPILSIFVLYIFNISFVLFIIYILLRGMFRKKKSYLGSFCGPKSLNSAEKYPK